MYPAGGQHLCHRVEGVSERLDGASRPGHFRGGSLPWWRNASSTSLLPTMLFFGQKDAAQVAVLRKDGPWICSFRLQLDVCPTVREPDGLAMSSRNRNLSCEQRAPGAGPLPERC